MNAVDVLNELRDTYNVQIITAQNLITDAENLVVSRRAELALLQEKLSYTYEAISQLADVGMIAEVVPPVDDYIRPIEEVPIEELPPIEESPILE